VQSVKKEIPRVAQEDGASARSNANTGTNAEEKEKPSQKETSPPEVTWFWYPRARVLCKQF